MNNLFRSTTTRSITKLNYTTKLYPFISLLRNMSTEYNVIIYDKPNADRSKVRPKHVAAIPATVPNPVRSAGAIYTDESKTKFAGSAFHLVANNRDEVIEFFEKDIYYKEGVWDIENVIINPIGVAVRLPKKMEGVEESNYKI